MHVQWLCSYLFTITDLKLCYAYGLHVHSTYVHIILQLTCITHTEALSLGMGAFRSTLWSVKFDVRSPILLHKC